MVSRNSGACYEVNNMRRTLSDHALVAAKTGLSCVPVVGGALATLVDAYIPEQAAKASTRWPS
jgi:hypothetical protein